MKKAILKFIPAFLVLVALMTTFVPKDVNAYTGFGDMTYDEVCAYWSAQPVFTQIYLQEYNNSGYSDQVKYNVLTYFKCSLNDCVWNESAMKQSRPQTYMFMKNVLTMSPQILYVIQGKTSSDSLRAKLMEEMKKIAPYLTYNERCQNADILLELLKKNGVTNTEQYKVWKKAAGMTAFEFYINHVLDYNDYWDKIARQKQAEVEAYQQQQAQMQQEIANQQAAMQSQWEQQQQGWEQQQQEWAQQAENWQQQFFGN